MAGYVAEFFGSHFVYLIASCSIIMVVIIGTLILPKKTVYGEKIVKKVNENKVKLSGRNNPVLKMICSFDFVFLIVFIMFPTALISGYKRFLFSCYASSFAISKVTISNFYILAKTFNMIICNRVNNKIERKDTAMFVAMMLIFTGLAFFGFILNNTILWAVIMIVVCDFSNKFIQPVKKMLSGSCGEVEGLSRDEGRGIVEIFISIIVCVPAPVFGALLLLGERGACIGLGAIIAVFGFLAIAVGKMKKLSC